MEFGKLGRFCERKDVGFHVIVVIISHKGWAGERGVCEEKEVRVHKGFVHSHPRWLQATDLMPLLPSTLIKGMYISLHSGKPCSSITAVSAVLLLPPKRQSKVKPFAVRLPQVMPSVQPPKDAAHPVTNKAHADARSTICCIVRFGGSTSHTRKS